MFGASDFKKYRNNLGFNSQQDFKVFLSAKDIRPQVDFAYIDALNLRIDEIFRKTELYLL